MASLRRMTSNVAAQIFAVAASLVDRIILVGFLIRGWGPDVFSDYSVIQSASTLLLIAELGIQIYFQNVQQAAFVARDKAAFRRAAAIHLGLILTIAGTLALSLSLLTLFGVTDGFLHLNQIDARTGRAVLWLMGVGNLLTLVRSATTSIYSATGHFAFTVVMTAVALVVTTLASIIAVLLGAGPTTLAAIYLLVSGAGSLIYFRFDIGRRFSDWIDGPALPTIGELRAAAVHLKWFSLQIIGPTVWLQAPVLVFDAWSVSGRDIASFLLIRTMVNQIRQAFQFATIGAGIEIAPLAHSGDFRGAWKLSARIGLMTTVLCGVMVAAVLIFGQDVTRYWVGDATLFSQRIAIFLLAPLLGVVFLQQPVALLQYANMSLAPGLQRLLQIVLGPLLCIVGMKFYGVTGLVIGLAISEVLANWALLPLLAGMKIFSSFFGYCLGAVSAGLAAAAASLAIGFGLMHLYPAPSFFALVVKMAMWTLLTLVPMMLVTLPEQVRQSIWRRLRPSTGQ